MGMMSVIVELRVRGVRRLSFNRKVINDTKNKI